MISHHWRDEQNTCMCDMRKLIAWLICRASQVIRSSPCIEKQHMLYYNWTFKNYTAWHGGVLNSRVDSKLFPKPIGVLPTSSTPSHSSRPVPLEALEAFCGVFVEWLIATGRARVFGLTTVKAGARSMMAKFFDERRGEIAVGKNGCGEIRQKNSTRGWQVAARP